MRKIRRKCKCGCGGITNPGRKYIWEHHSFGNRYGSKDAHPQMRELMIPLLNDFKELIPVLFDDIHYSSSAMGDWSTR